MEQATRPVLRSYLIGYGASLLTTLVAYALARSDQSGRPLLAHGLVLPGIIGLALLQFVIQLIYFLHLGRETRPRWKILVFVFMLVIVAIIVFGSLWIMQHLNYNMRLTPQDTNSII